MPTTRTRWRRCARASRRRRCCGASSCSCSKQLGYGLDLAHEARTGRPIEAGSYYHFHPSLGFVGLSSEPGPDALPGASVLALAAGRFDEPRALDDARRVMRAALDLLLEGRELRTRAVAQAVARRPRRSGAGTRVGVGRPARTGRPGQRRIPGGGTTGNGNAT